MSKKIVKELLTKWTYKVDTKQLVATAKLIKGLKGEFNNVRKASTAFGKGEFKRIGRIRKGWQGLNKQVSGYRKNIQRMPSRLSRGGVGGGGKGSRGGGRGGVGGLNSAAFLAGRMAGSSALTSALLGGPALAAGFGAAGSVKAAANRESSQVRFKSLLGGGAAGESSATDLLDKLSSFAKTTPFALTQLRDLAQQTLGGGFAKAEIIPLLQKLGDVTQGDNVKLNRMLQNMIEIKNVGKAFTRDIRQFGRAGIPIFKELQKNLGLTGMQLDNMITSGKVGYKEIENALITMTKEGGTFFQNMSAQMNTFNGQLNNLGDTITSAGEKLGKPFLKPFTQAIKFASKELEPFIENLLAAGSQIGEWISMIPGIKGWGIAFAIAIGGVAVAMFPLTAGFVAMLAVLDDLGVYARGGKSLIGFVIDKLGLGAKGREGGILVPKENDTTSTKIQRAIMKGFLGPILTPILDGSAGQLLKGADKLLDMVPMGLGASIDNRANSNSLAVNQTFNMGQGDNLDATLQSASDSTMDLFGRQSTPKMIS